MARPAIGRPRLSTCTEDHFGPCKKCARERARRYRRGEKREIRRARDRQRNANRQALVVALAYVHTALERGTITPPLWCDRCTTRHDTLHPKHPEPRHPRVVAWLCDSCLRYVRAAGDDVILHWEWPGARKPKRTRKKIRFNADAHAAAFAHASALPPGVDQYRAYADAYLKEAGDTRQWIATGLAQAHGWAPTGDDRLNRLWRWYVNDWWDRERERHDRRAVLRDDLAATHFDPSPVRETTVRSINDLPVPSVRVKNARADVAPEVLLERADAALEEFDRRFASIIDRVNAATESRSRQTTEEEPE